MYRVVSLAIWTLSLRLIQLILICNTIGGAADWDTLFVLSHIMELSANECTWCAAIWWYIVQRGDGLAHYLCSSDCLNCCYYKSGCDNAKLTHWQHLQSILCAFSSWTDEEYVTGYGVQVVGVFYGNQLDCTGSGRTLKAFGSVTFPNKVSRAYHIPCLEFAIYFTQSSSKSLCTNKLSFTTCIGLLKMCYNSVNIGGVRTWCLSQ